MAEEFRALLAVDPQADLLGGAADDLLPAVARGANQRWVHLDNPAIDRARDGHERRVAVKAAFEKCLRLAAACLALAQCLLYAREFAGGGGGGVLLARRHGGARECVDRNKREKGVRN